jgi:DNA polymerase elongation subunit (family B)
MCDRSGAGRQRRRRWRGQSGARSAIKLVDALGAPHIGERTEKQLIAAFCDKIAELKPQLITFNGNSFDLPVLRYRAMIHGVSAPGLAARLYFNRYTEDAVDLCDILSSFAPHSKASLNELSNRRVRARASQAVQSDFALDWADVRSIHDRSRSTHNARASAKNTLKNEGAITNAQMLTMACAIISDVLVPSSAQAR